MATLTALWLPILLSAVFVFVVSSVIHMVLPIHKGDYKKLPGEEATLAALRATGVPPGQFMFPCASSMKDMASPEMKAKLERGPVGIMVLRKPGSAGMGAALVQWFLFCVVVGISVAYVTSLAMPFGDASRVFRIAGTVAVLCHAFGSVNDSIWKGVSWVTTLKFVVDGIVYGLVTGATFAWLWPAA